MPVSIFVLTCWNSFLRLSEKDFLHQYYQLFNANGCVQQQFMSNQDRSFHIQTNFGKHYNWISVLCFYCKKIMFLKLKPSRRVSASFTRSTSIPCATKKSRRQIMALDKISSPVQSDGLSLFDSYKRFELIHELLTSSTSLSSVCLFISGNVGSHSGQKREHCYYSPDCCDCLHH